MRVKALKNYNWSINYQVVDFHKGNEYEVPEGLALEMLNAEGYVELVQVGKKKVQVAEENKAIKAAPENKETEGDNTSFGFGLKKKDKKDKKEKGKKGRPKKAK